MAYYTYFKFRLTPGIKVLPEKLIITQLLCLLTCSQVSATVHCTEAEEFSPHKLILPSLM